MAHFAEIDNKNIVTRVVVTDNNDPAGDEGYTWLVENLGGRWVKTSYNTVQGNHLLGGEPLRKNYAKVGFIYDEALDAFYGPQPYPSWQLDETKGVWFAPTPKPEDDKIYLWDESSASWSELTGEK